MLHEALTIPPAVPVPQPAIKTTTVGWVLLDLTFGAVLPVICLVFDPVVFQGAGSRGPLLGDYAILAYLFIGLEILGLCLWLLFRRLPAFFGGMLLAGAVCSFALGMLLLPFSVIGLAVGIGVLGLSPFLTAWVYGYHGTGASPCFRTNVGRPTCGWWQRVSCWPSQAPWPPTCTSTERSNVLWSLSCQRTRPR